MLTPRTVSEPWACGLIAYATVLNVDPKELIAEVGHDGSRILFPALAEPYCRRGFIDLDFYDSCIKRGYAPVLFENPLIGHGDEYVVRLHKHSDFIQRLCTYMLEYNGVVGYHNHYVAWSCDGHIYNGAEVFARHPTDLEYVETFCAMVPITKSTIQSQNQNLLG